MILNEVTSIRFFNNDYCFFKVVYLELKKLSNCLIGEFGKLVSISPIGGSFYT